jgi:CheY-like chemotaxis protein/HPt (histidine-containing phosphotransfer) domain-containing protein
LRPSDLLQAIIAALNGTTIEPIARSDSPGADANVTRTAWRILVVEDNPVNRTVAVSILEEEGHTVSVAKHGKEALTLLKRAGDDAYDMVFMDVQMPVMDGFEATQAIRTAEASTHDHLPIVAMTANAMKGDREKCLNAGMDDYVAKPVRIKDIRSVIARWDSACHSRRQARRQIRLDEAAMNIDLALDNLSGNRRILIAVLDEFLRNLPAALSEIKSAAESTNAAALKVAAHGLKGAASNVCAEPTRRIAERLERMGAAGDLREVGATLSELESCVDELRRFVQENAESAALRLDQPAVSPRTPAGH